MPRTHYHTKVDRTQFRKLPIPALYWDNNSTATTPKMRTARTAYLGGWNRTTGARTQTAQSPTNVAVIRVPRVFLGQKGIL